MKPIHQLIDLPAMRGASVCLDGLSYHVKGSCEIMKEPVRYTELSSLEGGFEGRVRQLLAELRRRGRTPRVYEAYRSTERQEWLYAIGRTREMHRRPVTWTRHSMHQRGLAVDIVCEVHGWNCLALYDEIERQIGDFGLRVGRGERCHVEDDGHG